VAAIELVHAGETVTPGRLRLADEREHGDWPGAGVLLSARESEVVALIARGLGNQEIAEQRFLSVNSVKTYIRAAYRKIGVTTRAQAVLWAMEHDFRPDPRRPASEVP
jgi:two-component system, NarL family, response regulator LiaR